MSNNKDKEVTPEAGQKKRKLNVFQTPGGGTTVTIKPKRDVSRILSRLKTQESKIVAKTIGDVFRQVVVHEKEKTICSLCCNINESKNITQSKEDIKSLKERGERAIPLQGTFSEFKWSRCANHLLKCPGLALENLQAKSLRRVLNLNTINSFIFELNNKERKEMGSRNKAAEQSNMKTAIEEFRNMLHVTRNFEGRIENIRVGDFDNQEFSEQTTLDYLITKIYAQHPSLPFSFIDSSSVKEFAIFISLLGFNDFKTRTMSSSRVKKYINVHAKKRVTNLMVSHLGTAAALGPINLYIDGWQSRLRNKITGCYIKGVTGYSFPFKTMDLQEDLKDDAVVNVQKIEEIIYNFQNDYQLKIGCVVTDNAGQLAKAKRILKVRWPSISFETCWAHQFNRVCAKLFSCFRQTKAQRRKGKQVMFQDRLSFFVSHVNGTDSARMKFKQKLQEHYGKSKERTPIKPIFQIRWNTVYTTVSSILNRQTAILEYLVSNKIFPQELLLRENTENESLEQPEVEEIAEHEDPAQVEIKIEEESSNLIEQVKTAKSFMQDCNILASLMKPISKAVLRFQGTDCNRATVVHYLLKIFGSINKIIIDLPTASRYGKILLEDLEKRWLAVEQPLYWLTYAFDLRSILHFRKLTEKFAKLASVFRAAVVIYYKKFMQETLSSEEEDNLRKEAQNFLEGVYDKECFNSKFLNEELSPRYWPEVRRSLGKESKLGALAVHVVNLHVTTADAERMFSTLGQAQNSQRATLNDDTNVSLFALRRFLIENHKLPLKIRKSPVLSHKEKSKENNQVGYSSNAPYSVLNFDSDSSNGGRGHETVLTKRRRGADQLSAHGKSVMQSLKGSLNKLAQEGDGSTFLLEEEEEEPQKNYPGPSDSLLKQVKETRRRFQVYSDATLKEMYEDEQNVDDITDDDFFEIPEKNTVMSKKDKDAMVIVQLERNNWCVNPIVQTSAIVKPDDGENFRRQHEVCSEHIQERTEDFQKLYEKNFIEHRGFKEKLASFESEWSAIDQELKKMY